jgi:Flp pilus assembly protein TadD
MEMKRPGEKHQAAAEAALIQANQFDKSNPSVWARLAIVSLQSERTDLAHQSLLQALKLKCQEETLFTRLGEMYRERGFLDLARATLERSISLRDTVEARVALAGVCQAQNRIEAVVQHLDRARDLASQQEETTKEPTPAQAEEETAVPAEASNSTVPTHTF